MPPCLIVDGDSKPSSVCVGRRGDRQLRLKLDCRGDAAVDMAPFKKASGCEDEEDEVEEDDVFKGGGAMCLWLAAAAAGLVPSRVKGSW